MMNQDTPNQTEFINRTSWEDQVVVEPVEPSEELESPKKRFPVWALAAGIGVLLLIVLIVVAVILRPRMTQTPAGNDPLTGGSTLQLTDLQRQVASLSAELEAADPVKTEFPFPPVNMELVLPSPTPRL